MKYPTTVPFPYLQQYQRFAKKLFYADLHHSCPQEIRNRKFQSTETLNINETRLDPNITNSMMIHLNDYLLEKTDGRNGGGACIYLRSFINYKLQNEK